MAGPGFAELSAGNSLFPLIYGMVVVVVVVVDYHCSTGTIDIELSVFADL